MKVLLRAPLLTLSGYGIHSRQVFEWLDSIPGIDLCVEILSWGLTSWIVNPKLEKGLIGKIMSKSRVIEKGEVFDVTFQVQLPDEWKPSLGRKNVGITAVVETDTCSKKWVDCCNKMDAIVTPSSFSKSVLLKSGNILPPIHVIPEWYNESIENNYTAKEASSLKIKFSSSFNFLTVGTITSNSAENDRKNIFYTIKWFCEEFANNKDVGLVIKTSHGKGTKIDKALTKNSIERVIQEVRPGNFPKITLLHGNMTKEEISKLYRINKIKCLISATKGEGYGLPIVEAAASGLPVVATNWSGHLDFMKEGLFIPVDYELEEIQKSKIDNRVFIEGAKWAKIDENDFKRKIRHAYLEHDVHRKNASKLKKEVRNEFSKSAVISKYNSVFLKDLRSR